MMEFRTLTQLHYSEDRNGPWQLYIFDANGYHSGGQWFGRVVEYPDEEITIAEAKALCEIAVAQKREVRICDGGDFLVFHSENGRTLHGESFWPQIVPGEQKL